jgi:rod shape-determining protein MreC
MRNIFLFIRRYFTFLSFLLLQAVALWFLFTYNRFHRARGLGMANEVTGWFNSRYNTAEDFFKMREENRRIHRMNDSLMNLLSDNFVKEDTAVQLVTDSIPFDTLGHYRRYNWRAAQVMYNTVNLEKNYIQINKGSNHGIRDDMGVLSSDGSLVGKVVNVSPNFSQVMSMLHVQNRVYVYLRKTGSSGTIAWDARDPRFLVLDKIPKHDSIQRGDTVLTGSYSGFVEEIVRDKATNFVTLRVRTAADFQDLQQVFIVENLQYDEQMKLLDDTRKKIK